MSVSVSSMSAELWATMMADTQGNVSRSPAMLSTFFVYNPDFGPTDETEQEKLLFYYPSDAPIDHKLRNVGLSEAMVNFTKSFSPTKPCEVVHTQKRRMVFLNPEGNYWMIMYIDLPRIRRVGRDGQVAEEYLENELHDSVLGAVLRQSYRMFKLFHSSFSTNVERFSAPTLRTKMLEFFPPLLARMDLNDTDLVNTLDGLQFLPLDKTLYLRVQSFINMTENMFPEISYSCFLHSDHLVWSGLEQDDIRVLYRCLKSGLLLNLPSNTKPTNETPIRPKKMKDSVSTPDTGKPGFLTGPADLSDPQTPINSMRVFVGPDNSEHFLIIYQILDVTVVFLMANTLTAVDKVMGLHFYAALHKSLAVQLEDLNGQIAKQQQRKPLPENQYRYIYFNHMNLALKSTIHDSRPTMISREAMYLLSDIHEEFNSSAESLNEICIKTASDYWIVGRRSEQREFYVILSKKDATLIDIHEEVKKLSTTQFANIFID